MVQNENLRARTYYAYTVQCVKCYKWRRIPTFKEFEEIRANVIEDPFMCSKLKEVTCEDPADMKPDSGHIWALDEAGVPKTPTGFLRGTTLRKDYSQMDVFYITPEGKKLRNSDEVATFLEEHQDYKQSISLADFSFIALTLMPETIPEDCSRRVRIKR